MHTSQADRLLGPPALLAHQIPRKPVAASQESPAQAADSHDHTSTVSTEHQKTGYQKLSHKHFPSTWHSLETWWGLEIAALVLAFTSFGGLILVLKQWDGRPQQQWSYGHLTLNGLVAILSTVTRATLLVPVAGAISQAKWTWFSAPRGNALASLEIIDQSSRGAWGSLRLLWHTRCCRLISIGALITVLALAFDTFSQQVILVDFRNVDDPGYKDLTIVPRSQNMEFTANNFPIKAAIANGIYNSEIPDLTAYCPTGNCTWPRIPTLGVCGGCTNVTDALNKTCQASDASVQVCNYTLPSGTFFQYSWVSGPEAGGFQDILVSSDIDGHVYNGSDASASSPYGGAGGLSTVPVYTTHFDAIYQRPPAIATSYPPHSNLPIGPIYATECALWFCLQAYDISTTLGNQKQHLRATWTTIRWPPGGENLDALPFANIPTDFNIEPANATYSLSYPQVQAMLQSFSWNQNMSQIVDTFPQPGYPSYIVNDVATSMWNGSGNWTQWIDRLSRSLTNAIRTTWPVSNSTNTKYYAGQVSSTQSYFHVRWAWLAFPAAMLLTSLLFLLASMWQTHRSDTHAWKDSALVLLSVALDPDILHNAHACLHEPGELQRQIGNEKVSLEKYDGGLQLRRVS